MAAMPNPPGMHRVPVPPGGRPPFRYAILDGEQVIGHTERRAKAMSGTGWRSRLVRWSRAGSPAIGTSRVRWPGCAA
jgi:hypothetical protein